MESLLKEKVVLISGAGRGIGAAAARLFAAAGARVVLTARSTAEIEAVAAQITADGGKALAITADIARPEALRDLVGQTRRRFGPVEILIDDAGVVTTGLFWESDPVEVRRLFDINVLGTYELTRLVLPEMLAAGRGRILNVSSGVAGRDLTGTSAYNASKAALERLMSTLATELEGKNITVGILRPGKVDTRMQEALRNSPAQRFPGRDTFAGFYQSGALLAPEIPARALLYMAGEGFSCQPGEVFRADDPDFQNRWSF